MINGDEYELLLQLNYKKKYDEMKNKNHDKNKYNEYCTDCNGYLNLSNDKKYLICSKCAIPYYDILPDNNKKKYHVNEREKIERFVNNFNYDILDKNDKMDENDKYKSCDLYLLVKRNIYKINRKYTFKMNFYYLK